MTQNAAEVFTMQLARAAGKSASKFLRTRGLQKADRDDVIAAAMLWCWENRANASLTTTVETWFMNAVRNAYQDMQRNELPTSDESIENIGAGDDTYETVAAESSAEALLGALTSTDKEIAIMTMQGYTYREMRKRFSGQAVDEAHQRIKQLRKLLPDPAVRKALSRTPPAGSSDDVEGKLSEIDMAIEQLDFPPPTGKDCPPCWRCMWFEGFMPAGKRDTRMEIEDPEVREAVKNTEARKIEIAQQVRDGL